MYVFLLKINLYIWYSDQFPLPSTPSRSFLPTQLHAHPSLNNKQTRIKRKEHKKHTHAKQTQKHTIRTTIYKHKASKTKHAKTKPSETSLQKYWQCNFVFWNKLSHCLALPDWAGPDGQRSLRILLSLPSSTKIISICYHIHCFYINSGNHIDTLTLARQMLYWLSHLSSLCSLLSQRVSTWESLLLWGITYQVLQIRYLYYDS